MQKFQYTRGSLLLKQTRATELTLELAPSYQTSLTEASSLVCTGLNLYKNIRLGYAMSQVLLFMNIQIVRRGA